MGFTKLGGGGVDQLCAMNLRAHNGERNSLNQMPSPDFNFIHLSWPTVYFGLFYASALPSA